MVESNLTLFIQWIVIIPKPCIDIDLEYHCYCIRESSTGMCGIQDSHTDS